MNLHLVALAAGQGGWGSHPDQLTPGSRGQCRSVSGVEAPESGNPIRPADLAYKWLFKNGYRPEDVYRSLFGGLNGTRMGSYASKIPDQRDRWALVAYVLSLSPSVRPVLHLADFAAERAERIGPDGRVLPPRPTSGP